MRFVRQPDGKLAVFSSIVDNFTHFDLSVEEAHELALDQYRGEAKRQVQRGLDDELPYTRGKLGDGTARWKDALNTIRVIHGEEKLREMLAEMGLKE